CDEGCQSRDDDRKRDEPDVVAAGMRRRRIDLVVNREKPPIEVQHARLAITGAGAMLSTNGKYLLNERDIQSTRPGSIKRRQARMPQGPWQDAPSAWVFETQRPPRVDRKAGLLIVAERARVIEAAGVHPEPVDRARPRPFVCGLQKERPELAADEFREEAETGRFRLTPIWRPR